MLPVKNLRKDTDIIMYKFVSWNIDSLNAALTSDSARAKQSRLVLDTIKSENPDFIALQETKLPEKGPSEQQTGLLAEQFPGYRLYWSSSAPPAKKGYAGTMILLKNEIEATASFPRIGAPETMDDEGRLICLEHEKFFFVNVYTPNAGDGLKRLEQRQVWDRMYADYLSGLSAVKPVIACGDFNVAHKEIDLANPDSNHMSPGFTDEERSGFDNLLSKGFTDSFRYLHEDAAGVYSWWSQRIRTAKLNNAGWRIDYFLVSDRIRDGVTRAGMLDSGERPDHTPIVLEIDNQ